LSWGPVRLFAASFAPATSARGWALLLVLLGALSAGARAQLTVTSAADDGSAGTLRYEIAKAAAGDTITFAPSLNGTITLDCTDNGAITLSQNVTIAGPGANNLTISGTGACQVFHVNSGVTATISGLTIANGYNSAGSGGGIYNNGTMTVSNSSLVNNESSLGGGGIFNDTGGTMTVSNSSLSGNESVGLGGGIGNLGMLTVTDSTLSGNISEIEGEGGGIGNGGTLIMSNSTVSGNIAHAFKDFGGYGGIFNDGTATISFSTIVGNAAYSEQGGTGGGIFQYGGTLTLKSTLLANNSSNSTGEDCSGTGTSNGYNLADDSSCTFLTATGDQSNVTGAASYLGPLQNNGGPTQTIALLPGSTAIDAIPLSACTDASGNPVIADQRGVTRPQGASGNCDIGAFEVQQTPTANACPSGQTGPAPCSYPITLRYYIPEGTTLGTNPVQVVTQGAANLDFTLTPSNVCSPTGKADCSIPAPSPCASLAGPAYCTVPVTFAPLAPGLRMGAITITDNNGNLVATSYIYGIGQGPAIAFGPGVRSLIGSGLSAPVALTVDAAGDVFIYDVDTENIVEVPHGCADSSCQITVASNVGITFGLAVDGAGNLLFSKKGTTGIFEIPAGCPTCQITLPVTLSYPFALAVDGAGNLFVADAGLRVVVKYSLVTGTQTTLPANTSGPTDVAVDAIGNVYIADQRGGRIVELPAGCNSSSCQVTVPISGLKYPLNVKVDAAGDLYIMDPGSNVVLEVPPGCATSACQINLGLPVVAAPQTLAVDWAGDVFVPNGATSQVLELQRSQPPSLSFASTAVGQTSSDSPQSVTLQNIGNQALDAVSPGLVVSEPNFVQVAGSGTPADCGMGFSLAPLAPGATCNLSVSFEPQSLGLLTGAAVFTDNALNASPSTTQSIGLSGMGLGVPPAITSANSATFTIGVAGSFTVTTTGYPTPSITEAGALPNGLAFRDNGNGTGTLYGTPLVFDGGDFGISFTANNGWPPAAAQAFTIILRQAPAITSANNSTFAYGVSNSFTVTTTGFPVPSIASAGGLPPGVTFVDNHNGTATLAGTPSAGGTFALVITATNAVTTVTQNFTLNVSGLSVSPSTLSFGTLYLNGSSTLPVTVTNRGGSTVTVSGVSISPATASYKAVSKCTSPLTPGKSCTISVTFTANAEGTLTATLSVMDQAFGAPQQVSLTGNVIDPVAQFNPTKLSFGTVAVHGSATLPVQLTNSGQTPLDISGIAIGGADAGDFAQTNNCPAILSAAMSCTISVTFSPGAKGARSGTLIVTDNVSGGQSTAALAGTGH